MLSVICPIYNEEKYIAGCIDSIIAQNYPKDDIEVIFADGMSSDQTRKIVAQYAERYNWIRLVDNPRKIVPPALNAAVKASRGDVIIRIDAHASYPSNYFSALATALKRYDADNVGAVCRTDVLVKTPKSLAIREVLAHPLGVGNSAFRTGIDSAGEVDTVPFGCWKRDVFEKYGYFDERLVRNQDIEFNKRIKRGGGRIVIIPETHSTYYARETFAKLAKNNFGNGKWNILTVKYTRQFDSLSPRHFIPLAFVLSLIIPLIAGIFWTPALWLSAASMAAYLVAVSAISAKIAIRCHLNFFYLVSSFAILHLSYGLGSLCGLAKVILNQ